MPTRVGNAAPPKALSRARPMRPCLKLLLVISLGAGAWALMLAIAAGLWAVWRRTL